MQVISVKGFTTAVFLLLFLAIISVPSSVYAEDTVSGSPALNSVHALKQQVEDDVQSKSSLSKESSVDSNQERDGFSIMRLFQGLGFCIAVFLAGVHVYKKYVLKDQPIQKRSMRILERISIAPKSSLLLVEVDKKKVLLAVGPEGTAFLNDHELLNPAGGYFNIAEPSSETSYQGIQEECKAKIN